MESLKKNIKSSILDDDTLFCFVLIIPKINNKLARIINRI